MNKTLIATVLCLACGSVTAGNDQNPWGSRGVYDAAKALTSYTYHAELSDDQKSQVAMALGWFSGAAGALQAVGALGPAQKLICVNKPQSATDVARGYVAYVDAHHGRVPDDPMVVLIDSLKANNPCK